MRVIAGVRQGTQGPSPALMPGRYRADNWLVVDFAEPLGMVLETPVGAILH